MPVIVTTLGGESVAIARAISTEGIYLEMDEQLRDGDIITVQFRGEFDGQPMSTAGAGFSVKAEVVAAVAEGSRYAVGLRFVEGSWR